MNDDAFARLVAEEVKNKVSQSQKDFLRLPDNWGRWQRALVALADNLSGQLDDLDDREDEDRAMYGALGDDGVRLLAEAMADYENKRKKIERFKYHVDNRLDEVTKMIALGTEAVDDTIKTLSFLRKAISTHRAMLIEFDLEATPVDAALWSALDGKWEFENITVNDL